MFDRHISFTSGNDIRNICNPILEFFEAKFLTYCRIYVDGSRAILTSTPESLYDLFLNKKYIFRERNINDHELDEFLPNQKVQYYFFSNLVEMIPSQYQYLKENYCGLMKYEKERDNVDDRFVISIQHDHYHESFIFAISGKDFSRKELYFNNLDILNQFRFYFLERARFYLYKVENDPIIKGWSKNNLLNGQLIKSLKSNVSKQIIPKKYYIFDKSLEDIYLTKKQMDCAKFLIFGYTNKEIAKLLNISSRTVESHMDNMKFKLSCRNKVELIRKLLQTTYDFTV